MVAFLWRLLLAPVAVCRCLHTRPVAASIVGLAWVLLAPAVPLSPPRAPFPDGPRPGAAARVVLEPPPPPPHGRFAALGDAEAWGRLPAVAAGGDQPLPAWARALAAALPDTTAAMLELDYAYRVSCPLPPVLRGKLRWAAAHADRCAYAEAYALADLRRAGLDEDGIRALTEDQDSLPADERAALSFARKLTLAAGTVTDAEVARLIERYGQQEVVALVLLLAHASFQDRLLLALDVPVEEGGPLPPVAVRFADRPVTLRREAAPPPPPRAAPPPPRGPVADLEWRGLGFEQLRKGMEEQRARRPRIALPAGGPGQVHWGAVCRAYQPELAAAWAACGHAFDREAEQDPVFDQSLFWVVTHAVRCFY